MPMASDAVQTPPWVAHAKPPGPKKLYIRQAGAYTTPVEMVRKMYLVKNWVGWYKKNSAQKCWSKFISAPKDLSRDLFPVKKKNSFPTKINLRLNCWSQECGSTFFLSKYNSGLIFCLAKKILVDFFVQNYLSKFFFSPNKFGKTNFFGPKKEENREGSKFTRNGSNLYNLTDPIYEPIWYFISNQHKLPSCFNFTP